MHHASRAGIYNKPLQSQQYPKKCSVTNTGTPSKVTAKTRVTLGHLTEVIRQMWAPERLHPKFLAVATAYIEEIFNHPENCSDNEHIRSAVHYVFTYSEAFSPELIRSGIECLADRSDIKDTKVFSAECTQEVNSYITHVFSNPSKYSKELIASAVNYHFATDAQISDDAVKNIASYVLEHQSAFSIFDGCITDLAGYIFSNWESCSKHLVAAAINHVAGMGEMEFSDEVTVRVENHVSEVFNNSAHYDDETNISAINYIKAFYPRVLTETINQAKTIIAQNLIFFTMPIVEPETFAQIYESNKQATQAIRSYTQGLVNALNLYPGRIVEVNQDNSRRYFSLIDQESDKKTCFFKDALKPSDQLGYREISIHALWIEGEFEAAIQANPFLAKYIVDKKEHYALEHFKRRE